MNRIQRCLAALARRARALPALAAAGPAALFTFPPPEPTAPPVPATAHPVVIGGMPGWQIALIAIGAALAAAVIAVLLDRARVARKMHTTTA
jgi:hypothetical protein